MINHLLVIDGIHPIYFETDFVTINNTQFIHLYNNRNDNILQKIQIVGWCI